MNRRSFFGRVFGGVAAAVVAPFLPKLTPKPKPTLWETFIKGDISNTPGFDWHLPDDAKSGVSTRYVSQWSPEQRRVIHRIDRLRGVAPDQLITSIDYTDGHKDAALATLMGK